LIETEVAKPTLLGRVCEAEYTESRENGEMTLNADPWRRGKAFWIEERERQAYKKRKAKIGRQAGLAKKWGTVRLL